MGGQQRLDPPAEGGIARTGAVQVGGPVGRVGPLEGFGEEGHQSGVGVGHGFTSGLGSPLPMPRLARECATGSELFSDYPPASASASQALANDQCRSAVRRGMPMASAASPSVSPAKKCPRPSNCWSPISRR